MTLPIVFGFILPGLITAFALMMIVRRADAPDFTAQAVQDFFIQAGFILFLAVLLIAVCIWAAVKSV